MPEMTGEELLSMLKSSIQLKSLGGVRCRDLDLPAEDLKWWKDAKIGMFVHWGLYSILGRGEWVRFNEKLPREAYEALADEFIPENFDMSEWTELAKLFGADYMVMVTRHHDGFALWNSPGSYEGFCSGKRGSGRDFVGEYVNACRKAGLKAGVYYSPMDWRFPGYFDPEGLKENAALMKKQCYAQVEELMSRYHPDILWYDGGWLAHKGSDSSSAWFWEPEKLNRMVRKYCPKILINPRSGWEGNFYCDEGSHEISGKILPVPWEKSMCICSGKSWGWMPDDPVSDFDWLIRMMVNVVCRGGNWLVNIGPDRNGKISPEIRERIREIGDWLRAYGESIYRTEAGPFEPADGVYGSTCRENRIFLHVLDTEAFRGCLLPNIDYTIKDAYLYDGTKLAVESADRGFRVVLPEGFRPEDGKHLGRTPAPDTIIVLNCDRPVEGKKTEEIHFNEK